MSVSKSSFVPELGLSVAETLAQGFLMGFPGDAARELELLDSAAAAAILSRQPAAVVAAVWQRLMPVLLARLIPLLDISLLTILLTASDSGRCANMLIRLDAQQKDRCLKGLPDDLADELRELMSYPHNSVGRIMDTQVPAFHQGMRVLDVTANLKQYAAHLLHRIYILDDAQCLVGYVDLSRLIQAESDQYLGSVMRPVAATVMVLDPEEVVGEQLRTYRIDSLPVVDAHQCLVGIVHADRLLESLKEDMATNLQTMVGVGREERALSTSWFAVRKRQGWLQINLLTGFLAASVVGLFESTIAQFTALAVLMPVAAGQSGNTGAQALAVTMRGLTLREITVRQWHKVMLKEAGAGFINGWAIAITCGLGVYVWSQSMGLALVIALAMVISMTIAGVSGALVPLLLKKLGQDPAQSSSIILTTITDVAGFMSFLGIATALSSMLSAG